jgi:prepilin-type N-terminal cleavage/methylation domain-containing protein
MKKGFTLIELLVVIAIIGVLASIVMVSMSSASDKAKDARLKGDLSQVRTLAELVLDDDDTYASTCGAASNGIGGGASSNYDTQLATIQSDIEAQGSTSTCFGDADSYCIEVALLSQSGYFYCIDSTGSAGATDSAACASANSICDL